MPASRGPRIQKAFGFSLIELLIVVAIISILATIGLPLAELAQKRTQEEELRVALRQIRSGLDAYKKAYDEGRITRREGESGYPPSLQALVDGVVDAKSIKAERMYFLRQIPRDPFADKSITAAQDTWALRSYQSSGEDPRPGVDVFDVKSKSNEIGMNGVPYRKW